MEGLICGSYSIIKRIGEGGMAEVWLAKHQMIEQYAAVKLLQPQMTKQPQLVKRFIKEAQAAAAIKHPGIVRIVDVGYTAEGQQPVVHFSSISGGAGQIQQMSVEQHASQSRKRSRRLFAGIIAAALVVGMAVVGFIWSRVRKERAPSRMCTMAACALKKASRAPGDTSITYMTTSTPMYASSV